jgi:hypothetical protein
MGSQTPTVRGEHCEERGFGGVALAWDIQRLIDQAEIRDVHLRYCRGVDRMDWALVRACYHPDGTDDHGGYKGGVDGFIAWVSPTLAKYQSTTHFTGNQLVDVQGDRAWAEHYARVYHRRAATGQTPAADIVANVRYLDRMERRGGQWRIAARVVVVDSDRVDPIEATWAGPELERGRRDKSDLSYNGL